MTQILTLPAAATTDCGEVDLNRGRGLGNNGDYGDVQVDNGLPDGAAVVNVAAGRCADVAQAASDADGRHAVRRGRGGVPVPPSGTKITFFANDINSSLTQRLCVSASSATKEK